MTVFINYITLMLVNLTAGLILLAYFLARGPETLYHRRWGRDIDETRPVGAATDLGIDDPRRWAPGFFIVGLIGLITGFHMVLSWPIVSSYNIIFGESMVLFSALFFAASLALWFRTSLMSASVYGVFAGIAAIVLGVIIIQNGLTRNPTMSGIGFILPGVVGVLFPVALALWRNTAIRYALAALLVVAALIWAITGYGAYFGHVEDYAAWPGSTTRTVQPQGGGGQ